VFRTLATLILIDFSNTAILKCVWYVILNKNVNALAGNITVKGFVVPGRLARFELGPFDGGSVANMILLGQGRLHGDN